jgi:hypothetical protein
MSKSVFTEVRTKAHDLLAKTSLYFFENKKPISEIIFVPAAIFARIIGTHDSIGSLLHDEHVVDAAVIALAQFELRFQLAWTAHDIKNATAWVAHSNVRNAPKGVGSTINALYRKPSNERERLHNIFSHLSGVKHANPVMSELVFGGRSSGAGLVLSTGNIEDKFSERFSRLLREFSIYQLAWSSHVVSLYVAKYTDVERDLKERLRQIAMEYAPREVELDEFMKEVTERQQGFFGLRARRETRKK